MIGQKEAGRAVIGQKKQEWLVRKKLEGWDWSERSRKAVIGQKEASRAVTGQKEAGSAVIVQKEAGSAVIGQK